MASICPEHLDPTKPADYGYNPAVRSIVDRLKGSLQGQCLARQLTVENDRAPCLVIEASFAPAGACSCDPATRSRRHPADQGRRGQPSL